MLRKTAQIWLLFFTIFCTSTLVQAQTPRLEWPKNFELVDDALHWDAVENAIGYRVRRLGIDVNARNRITVEVTQNSFDLRGLEYGYTFYVDVQAISGDPDQYQDSVWSAFYTLIRPFPTATPTNTPTATPTPTPTRVFLRGIATPQNFMELPGGKVAWDPVVGAVSYQLFISGGGEFHTADVFAPQTELDLTYLRAGVTYAVKVSAQGDGVNYEPRGRWTDHINITIPIVATSTPSATNPSTPTPIPTNTATNTPTETHSPTPRPTNTATNTPTETDSPTPIPTNTATHTPTATDSPTPIPTNTATKTPTATHTVTNTAAPTATFTETFTPLATQTKPKTFPRPDNLLQTGPSTLTWDPVEGAIGYRLRWRLPGDDYEFVTVSATTLEYTIVGLEAGLTYEVNVRALGDGNVYEEKGRWSGALPLKPWQTAVPSSTLTSTATFTVIPSPTESPTVPATQTKPKTFPRPDNLLQTGPSTLTWDPVEGAIGYRLRWGLPDGDNEFVTVSESTLEYTIVGLEEGLTYEVAVRALGDGDVYEEKGRWSGKLPLKPWQTAIPTSTSAATETAVATVTLVASPTDRPTDTPTNTPSNTPTNTATFTATDRPTNTATDTPPPTDTPSPTATDTPVPLCKLARPENFIELDKATVGWDAVAGAAGYQLQWRMPDGNWLSATFSAEFKAYRFAELQIGVTYQVRVQALGDGITCDEEGEWSNTIAIVLHPTATPTDTPTNTPTYTPTNTPTNTPTHTPTFTPTDTPTNTPTDTPTNTPTYTPTVTPTNPPTATPTPTFTPIPTDTPTFTPTYTLTPTPIPPTSTPVPPTATNTPKPPEPTKPPKPKTNTPRPPDTPLPTAIPTRIPPATVTDRPPTNTPDPYVEECRTSEWVSYTESRPVLPTGVCKYSCRKQCCSGNKNRCWNHSCDLISCT